MLTMLSKQFHYLAVWALMFTLLFPAVSNATPVADKDTNANGSWTDGTKWNPNGVPVAGESVYVNHAMSVTSDAEFGNDTNMSVWGGATGKTITISGGVTLTHVHDNGGFPNPGSLFQIPSTTTDARLQGSGTFLNEGTFQHDSAGVLYVISGPMQLDNSGVFEFTRNNGRIELYDNGTRFNNLAGGTVRVNMGSTTGVGRIMGRTDIDGQFVQNGNPFDLVQGVLVYAPPNMGTINDAAFTSLFGAGANPINANSEVRFSGGFDNITLTGGTKLDRVKFGSNTDAINARSGNSIINVSGDGISTPSAAGRVVINAAAGRAVINQGKLVLSDTFSGSDLSLRGDGSLTNALGATLEHRSIRMYLGENGSPSINNSGVYEFTRNNGEINLYANAPRFNNLPGGTVRVNMADPTHVARITGTANIDGQFVQSGNPIDVANGVFVLAVPNLGNMDDSRFASFFGVGGSSIAALSEARLAGGFTNITLTGGSQLDRVKFGSRTDAINARPGGSIINVSGTGISTPSSAGRIVINVSAGNDLINQGHLVFSSSVGGSDISLRGINGALVNAPGGSIEHRGVRMYVGESGNPSVNNSGLYEFTTANAFSNLYQPGTSFNNLAGGIVRANMNTGTSLAQIEHSLGGAVTFSNLGTVEVTKGILRVNSNVSMSQMDSTSISGGTWKVLADAENSQLDMLGSGASTGTALPYDGSITTIDADAALVLSQQGAGLALFPQLGSISDLDGSLYVHGSVNLPVGASPMNVSGTLGGDGTYTAVDDIVFTGGTLDPSSLSGGAGTLTINGDLLLSNTTELTFSLGTPNIVGSGINDLVEVNGNLVLDGILDVTSLPSFGNGTYRLFNYTGTLTDNGIIVSDPNYIISLSTAGQVNLLVVPEPATGLLLLTGIILFRRKRKAPVC